MPRSPFLDALDQRVLVFDGAMGTTLHQHDLSLDDYGGPQFEGCPEILNATRPDVLASVHEAFFLAGVDAVETNSFGSFPNVLAEYGIPERAFELSEAAARIAREVAAGFSTPDKPRFVIGSIGPGTKLPSLGFIDFATLRDGYQVQVEGLVAGGADVLLVETVYDLLQAKAAIIGARRAMAKAGVELPLMVQVTMETTGRMLVGTEIGAALTALEAMGPDVIGLNCATGPREMTEHLRHLAHHARTYLSCLPNAGLPSVVDGKTHYDLLPCDLAEAHARFVDEFGLNIVGGCCGTTPEHLAEVVQALGTRPPTPRHPVHEPGVASIYSHVPYRQELSFLSMGERTNATGSKAFRTAMLAEDWDDCLRIATEQVKEGANVLDLNVDYVGRDGAVDMKSLASRFATQVPLPLILDSTEPEVMEAGLQFVGGKPILNSANLEEGEGEGKRMDRVMRLAKEYGAAVICLAIDEEGQARTAEWKFRVCERLYRLAVDKYGIDPTDLIFDALTFPLGTGQDDLRRDAMETIECIRRVKAELPGASTTLGVSNVSFGLKPAVRHVLNSVFLHECIEAGLDSAIVHVARIMPMHKIDDRAREVAQDLVYDRRRDGYDPLHELMAMFEGVDASAVEQEDRSDWTLEHILATRIIDGDRNGIEADLDRAMAEGRAPLSIINDVLLEGMKTVGELFGSGQMQLPFVLQSAETMKAAVAHLEPHMEKSDSGGKGRIVLGTVRGDVHDIGKNLVDIILTNNGYEVHNLGIKVPVQDFVDKAVEVGADAIGMSGLLVKSTLIMRDNLEELNTRGLSEIPVMLGGAALTRTYVERDLRGVYEGRLFYGKDAFEGLRTMDTLMEGKKTGALDPDFGRAIGGRALPPRKSELDAAADVDAPPPIRRSPDVLADNEVFVPPFVGVRHAKGMALDDIAAFVNETALFRNQWQFRPETGETPQEMNERIRPLLRAQLSEAARGGWLVPAVAWGYFPANGDGNELVIWADDERTVERCRFAFPRQREGQRLCIADFYRPVESGEADWAAFHVVTMGRGASEHERGLFADDKYQEYLFAHGLGVEMTEALAEFWHHRIREEWGFVDQDGPDVAGLFRQQYRGGRYSWGYPACPDLEDQAKLVDLLDLGAIDVALTEEFMLDPEQSTSAIICHHPQAKYFIAR
jgi:5-methyltetrahydrofolate--homocysteine methyltransferase